MAVMIEGSLEIAYLPHKVRLPDLHIDLINSLDDIQDFHVIIEKWCKQNCEGDFTGYISCWSFELESDAVQFKLRWG